MRFVQINGSSADDFLATIGGKVSITYCMTKIAIRFEDKSFPYKKITKSYLSNNLV